MTDVVESYDEAQSLGGEPLVVVEGLLPLLPGGGPITVERLGTGHSNETFSVERDGIRWVLRRPPRPPYAPTAHDVAREHAVLLALAGEDVRAPKPLALHTDPAIIGAPFYLMEMVEGTVIREHFPAELDTPEQRRRALEEFVDALAEIHAVRWEERPLAQIGRPRGYLKRQLRRWSGQWDHNRTRDLPEIDRMGRWLADHRPTDYQTTLVHGDYKLDNAIFAPGAPARLAVIVDWEMATLGAPLADLGMLLATYVERGADPDPVLDFSPATATEGSLTRAELIDRYAARSGRVLEDVSWYEGLALWKLAILLEGSYKRHLAGSTTDPFFELLRDGVPRLAARALAQTRCRC